MTFRKEINNGPEISKECIKLIYSALKKRKLYGLFKKNYEPLRVINNVEINMLQPITKRIIFFKDGEYYGYVSDEENNNLYNGVQFFQIYKVARRILTSTPSNDFMTSEIIPERVLEYVTEDYFKNKNKEKKPHIRDSKFALIFGLLFAVIGVFLEILCCYVIMPSFLIYFISIMWTFTLIGGLATLICLNRK
jgi:hypothetical protein